MAEHWRQSEPAVRLLSGRWILAVFAELAEGGCRYQDLEVALDGISHKVLTETLRRAERDGLVFRHLDHCRIETTTLYRLTDLAYSLGDPVTALATWTQRNWPEVAAARSRWDQRADR
jgi:DNA-binding HxlR family transcriptional regulator